MYDPEQEPSSRSTTLTTSDTGLAAFLLSRGVKITSTSYQDGRCFWSFEALNIEALKLAYFNDAAVGCQTFLGNFRSLTSMSKKGRP